MTGKGGFRRLGVVALAVSVTTHLAMNPVVEIPAVMSRQPSVLANG